MHCEAQLETGVDCRHAAGRAVAHGMRNAEGPRWRRTGYLPTGCGRCIGRQGPHQRCGSAPDDGCVPRAPSPAWTRRDDGFQARARDDRDVFEHRQYRSRLLWIGANATAQQVQAASIPERKREAKYRAVPRPAPASVGCAPLPGTCAAGWQSGLDPLADLSIDRSARCRVDDAIAWSQGRRPLQGSGPGPSLCAMCRSRRLGRRGRTTDTRVTPLLLSKKPRMCASSAFGWAGRCSTLNSPALAYGIGTSTPRTMQQSRSSSSRFDRVRHASGRAS